MGVTVKEIAFYKAGSSVTSPVAGYESTSRRVVRYTLEVDGQGANELTLFHQFSKNSGVSLPDLCVNLSTESDAYTNANGDTSGYLATMSRRSDIDAFEVTLRNIVLVPGQVYYLWVYPKSDTYAWVNYHSDSSYWNVTVSGSAGLVYIDSGNGFEPYQCYIDNGSGWDLCIPFVDNGTTWDMCS